MKKMVVIALIGLLLGGSDVAGATSITNDAVTEDLSSNTYTESSELWFTASDGETIQTMMAPFKGERISRYSARNKKAKEQRRKKHNAKIQRLMARRERMQQEHEANKATSSLISDSFADALLALRERAASADIQIIAEPTTRDAKYEFVSKVVIKDITEEVKGAIAEAGAPTPPITEELPNDGDPWDLDDEQIDQNQDYYQNQEARLIDAQRQRAENHEQWLSDVMSQLGDNPLLKTIARAFDAYFNRYNSHRQGFDYNIEVEGPSCITIMSTEYFPGALRYRDLKDDSRVRHEHIQEAIKSARKNANMVRIDRTDRNYEKMKSHIATISLGLNLLALMGPDENPRHDFFRPKSMADIIEIDGRGGVTRVRPALKLGDNPKNRQWIDKGNSIDVFSFQLLGGRSRNDKPRNQTGFALSGIYDILRNHDSDGAHNSVKKIHRHMSKQFGKDWLTEIFEVNHRGRVSLVRGKDMDQQVAEAFQACIQSNPVKFTAGKNERWLVGASLSFNDNWKKSKHLQCANLRPLLASFGPVTDLKSSQLNQADIEYLRMSDEQIMNALDARSDNWKTIFGMGMDTNPWSSIGKLAGELMPELSGDEQHAGNIPLLYRKDLTKQELNQVTKDWRKVTKTLEKALVRLQAETLEESQLASLMEDYSTAEKELYEVKTRAVNNKSRDEAVSLNLGNHYWADGMVILPAVHRVEDNISFPWFEVVRTTEKQKQQRKQKQKRQKGNKSENRDS